MALVITPGVVLEDREIVEVFMTSSGPGGQNVNKVASAVRLQFDALGSAALDAEVKARLRAIAGRRMGRDGTIRIVAQRFASQERNREDARARLIALIRAALVRPTVRRATRIPKAEKAKRLDQKLRRSRTKAMRGRLPADPG